MSDYLILSKVTKTYDTPKGPAVIVKDFDLSIERGEFVCLIGHSGCGKSTLLSMVAGLNDITAGGIILPDTAQEKPAKGTVLAVGPGKTLDNGKKAPVDIKVGEIVLYGKYSGTEVTVVEWEGLRFAALICLDIELPALAARLAPLDLMHGAPSDGRALRKSIQARLLERVSAWHDERRRSHGAEAPQR